jgi:hypothetical protein
MSDDSSALLQTEVQSPTDQRITLGQWLECNPRIHQRLFFSFRSQLGDDADPGTSPARPSIGWQSTADKYDALAVGIA